MAGSYEVRRGERLIGPYTSSQIRDMAAKGQLRADDLIRQVGSEQWTPLGNVKGIPVAQPQTAEAPPAPGHPGVASAAAPAAQDPTDGDATVGKSGVALAIVGALFILLGIADVVLYNMDIWDVYAGMGITGNWIEEYTGYIAVAIGSLLIAAGKRQIGLPAGLKWILAIIGLAALLGVGALNAAPDLFSGDGAAAGSTNTIEANISQATAYFAEMQNACESGDEASFLDNADGLASVFIALKPQLMALAPEQQLQFAQQLMPAFGALQDPSCAQMTMQIMSGPNASRLQSIMNRIQNTQ